MSGVNKWCIHMAKTRVPTAAPKRCKCLLPCEGLVGSRYGYRSSDSVAATSETNRAKLVHRAHPQTQSWNSPIFLAGGSKVRAQKGAAIKRPDEPVALRKLQHHVPARDLGGQTTLRFDRARSARNVDQI